MRPWRSRGFSAADFLNLLAPRRGWSVRTDIAYGSGPRRMLDVYRPDAGNAAPVVVFFYGGSWQSGDRSLYRFVGASLAARGIVAVVPDYTVYPDARYPDFLGDAAQAVRFVRDQAEAWGGDPRRLVVMGHSAGAYIAAMLAFDRRWLDGVDVEVGDVLAGLVGLAGPYDFLPVVDPVLREIFGGPDRIETQPIRYVTADAPPALLIAPQRDRMVNPGNTARLAAQIRAFGSKVVERSYPHVGHLSILGALSRPLQFLAPVLDDVTEFVVAAKGRRP
ncbi:MAG: alpha/beta hydrolase [Pseudolabrys sp.]